MRIFWSLKGKKRFRDDTDTDLQALIAEVAGCSISSIFKIIKEDSIGKEDLRGHNMPKKISDEIEEEIKLNMVAHLKDALNQGTPISSKDIRSWLEEDEGIELHKTTLLNYLQKWGITWERLRKEEYRKERDYVLAQRLTFLKEIEAELKVPEKVCRHYHGCSCIKRRKLVFLDESYIHQHHVSNFGLTFENAPLKKPSGKGKRIVIGAALTSEGWLGVDLTQRQKIEEEDGIFTLGSIKYWTGNVGGDYHHNFNKDNFLDYFKQNVLRNLTEPSLIILDGARYHRMYHEDEFFPGKAKKQELKAWLIDNEIQFNQTACKEDLKVLAMIHWTPPLNMIEELAIEDGEKRFKYPHRVLYLPPYHPEYNGIELAWARVKHYIGDNPNYNLETILTENLPDALSIMTPQIAKNIISHIIAKWQEDLGTEIDPMAITLKIQENLLENV